MCHIVAKAAVLTAVQCLFPVDTSFAHSTHAGAGRSCSSRSMLQHCIPFRSDGYWFWTSDPHSVQMCRVFSFANGIGRIVVYVGSAVTAIRTIYSFTLQFCNHHVPQNTIAQHYLFKECCNVLLLAISLLTWGPLHTLHGSAVTGSSFGFAHYSICISEYSQYQPCMI